MTKIEEVVNKYIDMWTWIRDNLKKLRKEECGIIGAKSKYMNMYGNTYHLGACLLCIAYADCDECPLNHCMDADAPYNIASDYLLGIGSRKKAAKACDEIIKVHEDLKRNPTDLLRRSV